MAVVDSRYEKLSPQAKVLQDTVVLAQAWKKTHTFVRRHNWYADVLELDASGVCLSENLIEWSNAIAAGEYETSAAWLVPAPKNGLWCFKPESKGGWQPRRAEHDQAPVLRPLAHIGVREQTVATAVMLCLADCIESAQGDTSIPVEKAAAQNVFSYGNRLFCSWTKNHTVASFPWGNSNTYSRYFQDYQQYVERPLAVAKSLNIGGDSKVFVVSMDLTAFYDNIDIPLLVNKLEAAYENFYVEQNGDRQRADSAFWEIVRRSLSFRWRDDDLALAPLFRGGKLPMGLPQGLVASGFFANAYLLEFDREIGSFIDRKPRGRSFRVHDYCRYVDDLRLVISVDSDEDTPSNVAKLRGDISVWVQGILKKHTTPSGVSGAHLRLNEEKTQLESLVEIGTESGIGARMKTLQHQLSGPFDLDSLRQAEIGLNGLLSLAELGLIEEEKQVQGSLRLATLASLKHEVRDDTLTRFSAYRLVRSLRERRRMTDLTGSIEGESTADALRHEFQSASRRLVSAWAMNPSLVQVLRYALDLWPSPELLEPVEQALMSKLDDSQQNSEFGRRVAYYVLADMFKAGATETGRESKRDLNFRIADVDSYRIALANLASRTLGRVEAPWYVQQQASLFLASVGKTATLPQAAPELRFHRALHSFVQAKSYAKDITVEEEVVVALVGH